MSQLLLADPASAADAVEDPRVLVLAPPRGAPDLDLFVYGIPQAWARTGRRSFKAGERVVTTSYDPEKPAQWKADVKAQVVRARVDRPPAIIERRRAVGLLVVFVFPRPESLPKRDRDHVRKPDLDNLVKAIKDALKGIVYADDSQVVRQWPVKVYGVQPGVRITVWAL